ncbi:MAG: glycosyltransferase family 4 protein [Thermoanaerobaculia bacterium]
MRILFVTARPPWPARRGDQVRTAGLVSVLSRRHTVRVVAQSWGAARTALPSLSGGAARSPAAAAGITVRTIPIPVWQVWLGIGSAAARPLQVALHRHREFAAAVRREVDGFRPDVVVLVLSRIGDVLDELRGVAVVVDLVDALGLNMEQRALRQPLLRGLFSWEARRMTDWERRVARRSRAATVVAERDRRALADDDEELLDKVRVVPYGLRLRRRDPFDVPRHPVISLTGNLGYFPTVDGALWFARKVWPEIYRRLPRTRWWLAGARPARAVRRLAALAGVELFASPDDLGSITRRSAVAIAPMWSGSGTPIKILEAMAARVPVVTTRTACAGLDDLPDGAVSIANHPRDFAQSVAELLSDRAFANRQALIAYRWLQSHHDLEAVGRHFETVLEDAVELAAISASRDASPSTCSSSR